MEQNVEVNTQDYINILISQRNAAMDEIAKQGAIIHALQRRLQEASPASAPPTK